VNALTRVRPVRRSNATAVLLLDNYDSFTFNLFHYLGELGAEVDVLRNDAATPDEALAMRPDAVVISPGPCDPDRAGITLDLIEEAAAVCPVLGVCLGHQAIGQAFGGRVVRAPAPVHGKTSLIHHDDTGVFRGLPNPFRATRYHSLIVERDCLPAELLPNAWTEDGLIMGVRHEHLPVHGVQFHPESIASEHGHALLANFLDLAGLAPRRRNVKPARHAA
jgi:anthranilate synthase component II